jgi:hypothetical protein
MQISGSDQIITQLETVSATSSPKHSFSRKILVRKMQFVVSKLPCYTTHRCKHHFLFCRAAAGLALSRPIEASTLIAQSNRKHELHPAVSISPHSTMAMAICRFISKSVPPLVDHTDEPLPLPSHHTIHNPFILPILQPEPPAFPMRPSQCPRPVRKKPSVSGAPSSPYAFSPSSPPSTSPSS